MAYNTRRSGEGINNIGVRRNAPISNNFVPGGQLTPHNRPQLLRQGPRPQGYPNQSNGNFRPQQPQRLQGQTPQRAPGPIPQKVPPPKVQPQQQAPPQNQQQAPPQNQPPPIQQQIPNVQEPQPVKPETPIQPSEGNNEEQIRRKPFWATKAGKISRKERQRRRNIRLSKMLQPKNAVMILNELVKSATYTVTDVPQPSEMNQYTATVLVDGVTHIGRGRSKMEAKSVAAEAALKYIVKNRQFSAFNKDEEGDEKMDVTDDGTPTLPWPHVASFALYKLLNSWGEDPNQAGGLSQQIQESSTYALPQNKPAKKMPENAIEMNPLMLLNQMLPHAQFEELGRSGNPPNVVFTFRCTVDGQSFTGTGSNKKTAKKMAAFAVCHQILAIQYPPEIYTPI